MAEEYTTKERIIEFLQGFAFIGTPLILAVVFDVLLNMLVIFIFFYAINVVAELTGKKQHAATVLACWVLSNALLIALVVSMSISGNLMPDWKMIFLGIVTVTIVTFSISKGFYVKTNENIETKKTLRNLIQSMTEEDALKWLRKRLPNHLSMAILWLDWHEQDLNYVAFHISNCSTTVLKEMRSTAYKRLRCINSSIE